MSDYPRHAARGEAATSPPAAISGDAGALATQLFERYNAEIHAYLRRMVDDREWALDLAQETFLAAHKARGQIAAIDNPRAWLYRIATNLALNALKRRRRFAWLPWHWQEERQGEANVAEQVSRGAQIEAALAALAPDGRAALLLYAHHGLKVAEIAEALGISEAAARMRLQRAREQFRQSYRREDLA
jgi:RNA polymerase sigma-70 factor, ECF subfamily